MIHVRRLFNCKSHAFRNWFAETGEKLALGSKPHGDNVNAGEARVRCDSEALDLYSEALAIDVPYLKR